jgi:hypothetical protein
MSRAACIYEVRSWNPSCPLPVSWHAYSFDACPGSLPPSRRKGAGHDRSPITWFEDPTLKRHRLGEWRGAQILHRHPGGGVPDLWFGADLASLPAVAVGDGGADAVAVEQRRDDAAVEEVTRPCRVLGSRRPRGDRRVPVPCALQPETRVVVASASPAVVVHHLVLKARRVLHLLIMADRDSSAPPTCSLGCVGTRRDRRPADHLAPSTNERVALPRPACCDVRQGLARSGTVVMLTADGREASGTSWRRSSYSVPPGRPHHQR